MPGHKTEVGSTLHLFFGKIPSYPVMTPTLIHLFLLHDISLKLLISKKAGFNGSQGRIRKICFGAGSGRNWGDRDYRKEVF